MNRVLWGLILCLAILGAFGSPVQTHFNLEEAAHGQFGHDPIDYQDLIIVETGGAGMEQSDSGYVVPKRTLAVEIGEARGKQRGELFLAQYRDHDAQPQRIGDLLEGTRHFLPLKDTQKGDVRIVNRAAIVWLRVTETNDSDQGGLDELFDCRQRVRVVTSIGAEFEGDLLYDAPDARARVVDYANRPSRFLRLHLEEGMLFVNKDHIVELRELGEDES